MTCRQSFIICVCLTGCLLLGYFGPCSGVVDLGTAICPGNDWHRVSVEGSVLCLRVYSKPKSWTEAKGFCRQKYSDLLVLDTTYFEEPWGIYPDIDVRIQRLIAAAGIEKTWLGLSVVDGKLQWDTTVPLTYYSFLQEEQQFWQWNANQPGDMTGDCGAGTFPSLPQDPAIGATIDPRSGSLPQLAAVTQPNLLAVSLVACSEELPFICVNKGFEVSVAEVDHCDPGWVGTNSLSECYWFSGNKSLTYTEAHWLCQNEGAQLATPTDGFLHEFVVASALSSEWDVNTFWIGLKREKTVFHWENGEEWDATQGRFHDDTTQLIDSGCVVVEPTAANGKEWTVIGCQRHQPFVCQKEAKTVLPKITQHPEDLTISSSEVFTPQKGDITGSATNSLDCDADGYNLDLPIIWVKDNAIYIDNGPPPLGLKLFIDEDLAYNIMGSFESQVEVILSGQYHCEVWGVRPYKRVASNQATLKIKDVLQFRGSLTIPLFDYDPYLYTEVNLAINTNEALSHSIGFDIQEILYGLLDVRFKENQIDLGLQITQVRSGSVIGDFTVTYIMPARNAGLSLKLLFEDDQIVIERNIQQTLEQSFYKALQKHIDQQFNNPDDSNIFPIIQDYGITRDDIELRSPEACPRTTTNSTIYSGQKLTWKTTPIGQIGNSYQVCLGDGQPMAKRPCLGNYSYGAYWGEVGELKKCRPPPSSEVTEDLQILAQTETNEDNALEVGEMCEMLTNDTDILLYADVIYASQVMDNLAGVKRMGEQVGNNMVRTASNLLKVNREKIADAQMIDGASTRIVESLERYATTADLGGKTMKKIVRDDIALEIWDLPTTTGGLIGFGDQGDETRPRLTNYYNMTDVNYREINAAIIMSDEVLEILQDFYDVLENHNPSREDIRLAFTLYRSADFFLTPEQLESSGDDDDHDAVNSEIVALQLGYLTITGLTDPVLMIFKPKENVTGDAACVYWDFDALDGQGNWSTEGCSFREMRDDRVVCECDHLTNFAILTDYYQESVSDKDKLALSIITIIGLALSILGLVLTILTFLIFKKLRKGHTQKVLFNLAIALLCVNIIFLAGIERTSNKDACIAVAALLHYFLLVAFAWMLVEAVLQYLRLVKVIGAYVERFMLKTALPAWLLPAVPVVIIFCIDYELYRGPEEYCWLKKTPFYYSFMLPVGLIILINTLLYIRIVKSITCDRPENLRSTQSKSDLTKIQIRASLCVFVLLGVTWVFGFLAIEDARLVFQYLFCIFNALQGFLIFVFHTLREKVIRDAWRRLCCPKQAKKQARKSKKYALADTSDSNANSKTATSGTELSEAANTTTTFTSESKSTEPV